MTISRKTCTNADGLPEWHGGVIFIGQKLPSSFGRANRQTGMRFIQPQAIDLGGPIENWHAGCKHRSSFPFSMAFSPNSMLRYEIPVISLNLQGPWNDLFRCRSIGFHQPLRLLLPARYSKIL